MDASVASPARGSAAARNQLASTVDPAPVSSNSSSSNNRNNTRASRRHGHDGQRDDEDENEDDAEERHRHRHHHHHHRPRRLFIDTSDLDRDKPKPRHRHKHSKSRDGRLPRTMSSIAASSGARSLFPTRSSAAKDKDRDADDGLLRPTLTRSSRLGSGSTSGPGTGSRKGSLVDGSQLGMPLGLVKRREIRTMEDLQREREQRKLGEASLRSALSSIGTLATDITRRLDYTYYSLLEKLSALHSTIDSLQELSDSTALFCSDFQRETSTLDQEARRQLEDFKGFLPQIQKIDALERRMKAGRERVEALGDLLEAVKAEIDGWERREREWQARISRRLRILWAVMGSAIVILIIAVVIQNWPSEPPSSSSDVETGVAVFTNQSLEAVTHAADQGEPSLKDGNRGVHLDWSLLPLELANLHGSGESTCPVSDPATPKETERESENVPSKHMDALQKLDEL